MSYTFYKFLHLSSLFVVLASLGAVASHRLQGGTKENFKNRKFFSMLHGIALLVSFVAGFGLIAKAGYNFQMGWVWAKLAAWLIVGMYPIYFYKKGETKMPYFVLLAIVIGTVYIVEYKPF